MIMQDWFVGQNAGISPRIKPVFFHFFISGFQVHAITARLLFPSFVEFQYSLFHRICRFVGFPVLVHALTYMEETWLFAVLCPQTVFSFTDAEDNPAVQAFCEHPARFGH
jgi:hypothetical protein